MKKIVYILMIALVAFGLSGCGVTFVKVPEKIKKEFEVTVDKNVYTFYSRKRYSTYSDNLTKGAIIVFDRGLKIAENFGKQNGYKYMAIVNEGTNNLVGFPLNTKESFDKYIGLKNYKHFNPKVYSESKDTLFNGGSLNLKVIYFKEKIPGLFLFKL
jgi:hypothetical protein